MEDKVKSQHIIFILTLSILSSGCSSFIDSTNKYLFGDEETKSETKKNAAPTKEEYSVLLAKYKNLQEKYNAVTMQNSPNQNQGFSQVDEMSQGQPAADTVDAFAQDIMQSSPIGGQLSQDEVGQEIKYYKKGVAFKLNGNIDAALKVFQYLERSKTNQVRVRAKHHIAQIYMSKNQFDLALQVNEDIIKSEGYSGKVLKALEDSVLCASKLGLENKKLQYKSMLTDFFNIRI